MRTLLLAVLIAGLAFAVSSVQTPAQRLDIPFDFLVGNRVYPAGPYEIMHADMNVPAVTLRSGNKVADAMVITWLAKPEPEISMVKLVFDKIGDKRILSEVWMPGQEGLLVYAQKGKHEHQTLAGN